MKWNLTPVSKFLSDYAVTPKKLETMTLKTVDALGYYLAEDIRASEDLPGFFKSRADGYAVNTESVRGASPSNPVDLKIVGEVTMGLPTSLEVKSGECAYVPTGGMMPKGTDAVVMIEDTEKVSDDVVRIFKGVEPYENTAPSDIDYKAGDVVLHAGTELTSHKIMGLFYAGVEKVKVYRKARVGIISTGDEVIEPFEELGPAQVRDSNSYSVTFLLREKGFPARRLGIVKDDPKALKDLILSYWDEFDVFLVCGGNSAGKKDFTKTVFNELGKPGVLVHGVRIKPGKPFILAIADDKVLMGLPGHPVSSYVSTRLLVLPVLVHISGGTWNFKPDARVIAAEPIPSEKEREEYVRVYLEWRDDKPFAVPVLGTSSMISTVLKSHGLVRVPVGVELIEEGTELDFFRW